MEDAIEINFDPEVNNFLVRLKQLRDTIEYIANSNDKYFEDENFKDSLLLNAVEEKNYLEKQLKQLYESIPEISDPSIEEIIVED